MLHVVGLLPDSANDARRAHAGMSESWTCADRTTFRHTVGVLLGPTISAVPGTNLAHATNAAHQVESPSPHKCKFGQSKSMTAYQ